MTELSIHDASRRETDQQRITLFYEPDDFLKEFIANAEEKGITVIKVVNGGSR